MEKYLLAITLLFLIELVNGRSVGTIDTCKVGSSLEYARDRQCNHGGCAVVSYKNSGGVAEYKCKTDVGHAAITLLTCEYGTVDATCFDQWSNDPLPQNAIRLGMRERTYGDVLQDLGIERFCCCQGSHCSSVNPQIQDFFNLNSRRPEQDRYPQYPRPHDRQPQEPRVWEDDFPRRPGHRHNHDPNSASNFGVIHSFFLGSTVVYALLRLIF